MNRSRRRRRAELPLYTWMLGTLKGCRRRVFADLIEQVREPVAAASPVYWPEWPRVSFAAWSLGAYRRPARALFHVKQAS